MGQYQNTRQEIKRAIILELTIAMRQKGVPATVDLSAEVEPTAELLLAEFERLAEKHKKPSWWYGVGQSVAGSFLVFVVLGLAALAILGSKQDPRDLAKGKVNNPEVTSPSPSPSPTTTPTR